MIKFADFPRTMFVVERWRLTLSNLSVAVAEGRTKDITILQSDNAATVTHLTSSGRSEPWFQTGMSGHKCI